MKTPGAPRCSAPCARRCTPSQDRRPPARPGARVGRPCGTPPPVGRSRPRMPLQDLGSEVMGFVGRRWFWRDAQGFMPTASAGVLGPLGQQGHVAHPPACVGPRDRQVRHPLDPGHGKTVRRPREDRGKDCNPAGPCSIAETADPKSNRGGRVELERTRRSGPQPGASRPGFVSLHGVAGNGAPSREPLLSDSTRNDGIPPARPLGVPPLRESTETAGTECCVFQRTDDGRQSPQAQAPPTSRGSRCNIHTLPRPRGLRPVPAVPSMGRRAAWPPAQRTC